MVGREKAGGVDGGGGGGWGWGVVEEDVGSIDFSGASDVNLAILQ